MPTYVYWCKSCQIDCEMVKKISESENPEKCKICDEDMSKIPCNGSFKLLGGGWADSGYHK